MKHFIFLLVIGVGISFSISCYVPMEAFFEKEEMPEFFLSLATLSAIFFGFISTNLTLLLHFNKERLIENMKVTGHYHSLISALYEVAVVFLLAVMLSLLSFFVKDKFLWSASLGAFIVGMYIFIRTGKKLYIVIEVISRPDKDKN